MGFFSSSNESNNSMKENKYVETIKATSLELLDKSCTELIKNRSEARITLDSNEKQYPLFVTNNV